MQTLEQCVARLEPWWHPQDLALGDCWHIGVGTLSVYVQRLADQWLVATKQLADTEEHYRVLKEQLAQLPEGSKPTRFVFKNAPSQVCLTPKPLDRPVVVKTTQRVQVPPGESITFFISAPICVNVGLPALSMTLQEPASLRLSDTWFGPNTQVGELCYAAKTHARNTRAEVPLRPHRAVTPVTISNEADQFLSIEKLSIPVPYLAVYGASDGTLWTDPVMLTHHQGSPLVNFTIGKERPAGELLTPPRITPPRGGLVRAFTNIFTNF